MTNKNEQNKNKAESNPEDKKPLDFTNLGLESFLKNGDKEGFFTNLEGKMMKSRINITTSDGYTVVENKKPKNK